MANGFYLFGLQGFARGEIAWKAAGGSTPRTALVDTADYTVDLTNHNFMDDVAAGAREETSGNMTLSDATPGGNVDATDVTFVGTAGDACEAILTYDFNTNDADSVPLFWWDTVAGLPVTLGGDVTVQWNAAGIATI